MSDPLSDTTERRDSARQRIRQSLATTKIRLSPAALKQDLIDGARDRVEDVVDAARKRPALTAGIIAASALILLRKPLTGVIKRLSKEN